MTTEQGGGRSEAMGAHAILAFVNTILDDDKRRSQDSFRTGEELLDQLRQAGFSTRAGAPGSGQLSTLLRLREAAYGVLSAMAAGRRPGREDSLAVEVAIKSAMEDATLAFDRGLPRWQAGPLGGLHDELVLGLASFLHSPEVDRLRECRRCTRLFLDHGRGPGRRWCSMARCGNRAKAESFRARKRSAA
jgi:predicted RNA-binding Zn ribbon-like protein